MRTEPKQQKHKTTTTKFKLKKNEAIQHGHVANVSEACDS